MNIRPAALFSSADASSIFLTLAVQRYSKSSDSNASVSKPKRDGRSPARAAPQAANRSPARGSVVFQRLPGPRSGFARTGAASWHAGGISGPARQRSHGPGLDCRTRSLPRRRGAGGRSIASRTFYPPAAANLGIELANVFFVRPPSRKDFVWALNQSLSCQGVGAVVCWPKRLDSNTFRQLQLAAENAGTLGLLFRRQMCAGIQPGRICNCLSKHASGRGSKFNSGHCRPLRLGNCAWKLFVVAMGIRGQWSNWS